eukprot:1670675-Rhodomonas_salina.1
MYATSAKKKSKSSCVTYSIAGSCVTMTSTRISTQASEHASEPTTFDLPPVKRCTMQPMMKIASSESAPVERQKYTLLPAQHITERHVVVPCEHELPPGVRLEAAVASAAQDDGRGPRGKHVPPRLQNDTQCVVAARAALRCVLVELQREAAVHEAHTAGGEVHACRARQRLRDTASAPIDALLCLGVHYEREGVGVGGNGPADGVRTRQRAEQQQRKDAHCLHLQPRGGAVDIYSTARARRAEHGHPCYRAVARDALGRHVVRHALGLCARDEQSVHVPRGVP